jgi:hypothetical protein
MKRIILSCLFIGIAFFSCQAGPENILEESKSLTEYFIKDLKKVHNRNDALKLSSRLKKHYQKFASLMIEAKELEKDAPEFFYYLAPHEKNDELRYEFKRLYQIQGVGSVLEDCQKKALHDLYLSSVFD